MLRAAASSSSCRTWSWKAHAIPSILCVLQRTPIEDPAVKCTRKGHWCITRNIWLECRTFNHCSTTRICGYIFLFTWMHVCVRVCLPGGCRLSMQLQSHICPSVCAWLHAQKLFSCVSGKGALTRQVYFAKWHYMKYCTQVIQYSMRRSMASFFSFGLCCW